MARPTIIAPGANMSVVIFGLNYFRGFFDGIESGLFRRRRHWVALENLSRRPRHPPIPTQAWQLILVTFVTAGRSLRPHPVVTVGTSSVAPS